MKDLLMNASEKLYRQYQIIIANLYRTQAMHFVGCHISFVISMICLHK